MSQDLNQQRKQENKRKPCNGTFWAYGVNKSTDLIKYGSIHHLNHFNMFLLITDKADESMYYIWKDIVLYHTDFDSFYISDVNRNFKINFNTMNLVRWNLIDNKIFKPSSYHKPYRSAIVTTETKIGSYCTNIRFVCDLYLMEWHFRSIRKNGNYKCVFDGIYVGEPDGKKITYLTPQHIMKSG